MQNNIPPSQTPKKSSFLKIFLASWSVGSILLFLFVFDKCSGSDEERFAKNENKKLSKTTLPDEYKSYQYISNAVSGDKYEIEELEDIYPSTHYFLPDGTLILSDGMEHFVKIDTYGKIIDRYESPSLRFYGTSLMSFSLTHLPIIEEEDKNRKTAPDPPVLTPILSGFYSTWPVDGDTTLHPMEPASKIIPNSRKMLDAYNKADVVKSIIPPGDYESKGTVLHIDGVWYVTNYTVDRANKIIHAQRDSQSKSLRDMNVSLKYKHPTEYFEARQGAFVIGGASSSGSRGCWKGDAYLKLQIGNTWFPFKVQYREPKSRYESLDVYLDLIQSNRYAIVDKYIIREK